MCSFQLLLSSALSSPEDGEVSSGKQHALKAAVFMEVC